MVSAKACPKCGATPDIDRPFPWVVSCEACANENDGRADLSGVHLHDQGKAIEAWNDKVALAEEDSP
jgi:hypothetical protein